MDYLFFQLLATVTRNLPTLGHGLGLHVLSRKNIIRLLYLVKKVTLEEMFNKAKGTMQRKPDNEQGSFQRAITTADGCWLTRGHFSKNFTLHVKDFLMQALLSSSTTSICVKEAVMTSAKKNFTLTCEGYAASRIFQQTANEGMNIEVNWQDGDSSSVLQARLAFVQHFPIKKSAK